MTAPGIRLLMAAGGSGGGGVGIDGITWRLLLEAQRLTGLADGNAVSTWADDSGNGHDATSHVHASVTDPTYKTGIVNGKPVVRWNGSTDGMELPTAVYTSLTEAELFIVGKHDATPPTAAVRGGHILQLGGVTGAAEKGHFPWIDNNIYETFGTTSRRTITSGGDPLDAGFFCYNVRAASGAWSAHLDGSSIASHGTNTFALNQYGPLLGVTEDRVNYFDGDIALIAISPTVLSSGDRDTVEAYITQEYGVTFA